jgi:hypothetical protein
MVEAMGGLFVVARSVDEAVLAVDAASHEAREATHEGP